MASQIQWASAVEVLSGGDEEHGHYTGLPANLTAVDAAYYSGGSEWDNPLSVALRLSLAGYDIPTGATVLGIALVKGGDYGYLRYTTLGGTFSLAGGSGPPNRELTDGFGVGPALEFPWGGPTDLWDRTSITPAAINGGFTFDLSIEAGVYVGSVFNFDALGVQVWYDVAEASDPAHTTASVPGGVIGAATEIVVQARTSTGVDRGSGGDTVVVTVTGDNPCTPTVTDNDDGTYTASYVPTTAGSDSVAITLGGTAISGSPYTSDVVGGGEAPPLVNELSGGWS